ncbi:MAG: PAC2 family protein [Actinobacteria bacterium]|nr:PAC2 family protein [Actinomycetota bacterium]
MARKGLMEHPHYPSGSFCAIDPEEFFDFTVTRPEVRMVEGKTRVIDWPANVFEAGAASPLLGTGLERAHGAGSAKAARRHVIFLHGTEPQLRWRAFTDQIIEVIDRLGVGMVVTVGALLADVAHRRPVRVTGTSNDPVLAARLGLVRNRYEGPTGIVGVLHEAFSRHGVPSASLWASVPHYVAQAPSPKATQALVERISQVLGVSVDTSELLAAAEEYEHRIDELVADDEDAAAYVAHLEQAQDAEESSGIVARSDPGEISAERLAEEAERFLRDQP